MVSVKIIQMNNLITLENKKYLIIQMINYMLRLQEIDVVVVKKLNLI